MTEPQIPAAPPTTPAGDPPPEASPSATTTPNGGGDTTPPATDQTGTDATPPWGDGFDPARAWETIQKQRKAEDDLKAKLAAERKKVEDFERAQMTEAERVKADLEQAQRERDEAVKNAADIAQRQAFDTAAIAAGVNPKALNAARVIAADVATSDESGNMTINESLFDAIKAEHGYLFTAQQARPPQVTFGAATGQGQGGHTTSLTPEQVAFAQKAGIPVEDFAQAAGRIKR